MIDIDVGRSSIIDEFLNRYQIWADNKQFYHGYSSIKVDKKINGIPCYQFADFDNINNCDSDIVIIDALLEGLHSAVAFNRYNKSKHYIIVSSGTWNKDLANLDISYDLIWYPFALFETVDTYLSPGRFCFYIDKNYTFEYPKPLIFLCTAGSKRAARDHLVNQLDSWSDKNFILKYEGKDLGVDSSLLDIIKIDDKFDPYTPILSKYYHNVSQTLPINMYNQCYFNLVVETDVNIKHSFLPTEKIIKTLVTGMPFVAVATQDFIKHLHTLGFKTYQELWDESYDNEPNYQTRIDKVVDLCNNLKNFDWQSNQEKLQSIANHNARNFLNLNLFADKMFLEFESVLKRISSD